MVENHSNNTTLLINSKHVVDAEGLKKEIIRKTEVCKQRKRIQIPGSYSEIHSC